MKEEKSCGAVIYRVEQGAHLFLLLKYGRGHWGFPKGHVEGDEEEKETAAREVEEETGISDMEFLPGFRKTIKYTYKSAGILRKKTVTFFLAGTRDSRVKLSHEHQDYKWLPSREAVEKITYDDEKGMFRAALEHIESHDRSLAEYF